MSLQCAVYHLIIAVHCVHPTPCLTHYTELDTKKNDSGRQFNCVDNSCRNQTALVDIAFALDFMLVMASAMGHMTRLTLVIRALAVASC